ncbi:hypothetical protein [Sinorhizobium meliloti]|uniref:hypothetical protein n=1 Tax=Rhizobium meliloti TaxID=382 RepID=UPI0013E3D9ED|nr:hypothetical protein [Sinorhizobium meliloti]
MKMFAMPNGRLPEDQKALDESGLLRRKLLLGGGGIAGGFEAGATSEPGAGPDK